MTVRRAPRGETTPLGAVHRRPQQTLGEKYRLAPDFRLYGHRGASARLPENTLESFELALTDGAEALEMDVHRTADGHIVVAHDPDGRRTALRDERISDLSLDQLMDWNVAAGFPKLTTARMSIPALETVLDRFPGLPVAVDLKPNDAALVPSFLELIRACKSEDRVTVGSFHGHMIRRLRKLGYRGPTGLTRSEIALVRFLPKSICRILVQGEAAMIPTRSGAIRLDGASFIRRCRSLGLRVDYWVVNDPEEARKLADNGATGIVTDDPRQIVPVLAGLR